jgi:UDPglucose--hexose-1-phosphate uridylyltransferase
MQQLRWHALLEQWVAVSTHRQDRPQMPSDWCPFDPGSGHVPDHYDVYLYPNDFPAFSPDTEPFAPKPGLFAETGARGVCDVILYSPEHTLPPSKLSVENWRKIIDLWTERTRQLADNPHIAFVAPFENCGAAVGVTMPHPHGQIYAMPFIPPNIEREISSARHFAETNGGDCLFCRLLQEELKDGSRIIAADDQFVAFVPYAARFPAEVMLYPRRHTRTLLDLSVEQKSSLANMLSITRRKYDHLYGFVMPLMMAVKQAPLRDHEAPYHFHVQFMPLQRSPTKLKYLATMETGFGTFLADTAPEKMADCLRRAEPPTAI